MLPQITKSTAELWRYKVPTPMPGSMLTSVDVIVVTLEDKNGVTGMGFSYVIGGGDEMARGFSGAGAAFREAAGMG